jgi:tetratricopeptide (TPR) repeat protein
VARRYFRLAHANGDRATDPTAFGASLYFHAMYEMGLGHWAESEHWGGESLAVLERIGNRQEAEIARTVVANTLYFEGRFLDAAARCDALLDSARQRMNVQHLAWGSFLKGRSLLAIGRSGEAMALLEQGYGPLREVHDFVSLVMCEGLLAKALLVTGHTQRALEVADVLLERTRRRGIVLLAQCLDGYAALADVYLTVWEREGARASPVLRAAARRATTVLGRFARIFGIAKPAALRSRGWERWLSDRPQRAVRSWEAAVEAAEVLRMPYEQALAHDALGRALRVPEECRRHGEIAHRLLHELGCPPPPRRREREPA